MLLLILSPDELGIGTVSNGNLMLGARVRETKTNVVVMVCLLYTSDAADES